MVETQNKQKLVYSNAYWSSDYNDVTAVNVWACSIKGSRTVTYHGGHLTRHQRLPRGQPHLLHQRILQRQVIASVDQQLVLQVLRRVEILAWRLVSVTPSLQQQIHNVSEPIQLGNNANNHSTNNAFKKLTCTSLKATKLIQYFSHCTEHDQQPPATLLVHNIIAKKSL